MLNYDEIIGRVAKITCTLSVNYISILKLETREKEIDFAYKIINSLCDNKDLLLFLSHLHKIDLLDALLTHGDKYTKLMQESSFDLKKEAFKESVDSLILLLKNHSNPDSELEDIQRDASSELIYKMTKNLQTIFSEQLHQRNSIESFLAFSITSNLLNLTLKDQSSLFEQILLIKELWSPDEYINSGSEQTIYSFFLNPFQSILLVADDDLPKTFTNIIIYFTETNNVLESLSDNSLIVLYDRLKNYQWNCDAIKLLLANVHKESRCRYNYNRLNDSRYEMLKRFQIFDAIIHQIENFEFIIIEYYLLKKSIFVDKILNVIAAHLNNIRALDIIKNTPVNSMFSIIKTHLLTKNGANVEISKSMIYAIKSKLSEPISPNIKKRYTELDQYSIQVLQQKYLRLFQNIANLIEEKNEYKSYLKELLVIKFASDYYMPSLSNSISKLRTLSKDREEIKFELSTLNLIDIYQPQYLNKMSSLNFRKGFSDTDLITPENYISGIIREIVLSCNAFQLEELLMPLVNKKLSKTQSILKNQIISQIHQRTTLKKMLYSIFSGRKKEHDKLKKIAKINNLETLI
jgi:hypothetical protein